MDTKDRRTFLKLMGAPAFAAAIPLDLGRVLSIPAHHRTGTINDVEHIVFLMQENRSFDHYFGTLRGVRGFGDPRAVKLPSGQARLASAERRRLRAAVPSRRPDLGMPFLPDPPHGWNDTHAAWNDGKYDQWVPNKGPTTMAHHTRSDIPFHYALADAFTICDAYHCSLMGPTDPNRYHMWTGWVGNDGAGGGPVHRQRRSRLRLVDVSRAAAEAGISWKVYQDAGVGLDAAGFWGWTDDAYIGNYGDNSLLYFHQYQNALPAARWRRRRRTGTNIIAHNRERTLFDIFREDVRARQAAAGVVDRRARGLQRAPELASRTTARGTSRRSSTCSTVESRRLEQDGLLHHLRRGRRLLRPHGAAHAAADRAPRASRRSTPPTKSSPAIPAIAAGPTVSACACRCIVISPWTKAGWVNSQLFDHTSMIRFLEARFARISTPTCRAQHHPVAARGGRRPDHRVRLHDAERVATDRACRARTTSSRTTSCGTPTRCPSPRPSDTAEQEPGVRPARAHPLHPARARRRSRPRRLPSDPIPKYRTRQRRLSGPFRQQRGSPPHVYR